MFYFFEELTSELSLSECLVFSLIHSIYFRPLQEGEERVFYASNNYIATRLGVSKRTVGYALKALEEKGYIVQNYYQTDMGTTLRTITPKAVDVFSGTDKPDGSAEFCKGVLQKLPGERSKNYKGVWQELQPINKFKNNNINIDICTKEQDFAGGGAKAPVSACADERKPAMWFEDGQRRCNPVHR